MKKIVILGNSLSSIKVLEELKAIPFEFEAIFISQENTFPYYRNFLPDLSAKKINHPPSKIFYHPASAYEGGNSKFIFDKKVTRVNFKRGRLTLDDKDHVDYDFLILADTHPQPFSSVKGSQKTGLYYLKRLTDMSNFLKTLPLLETVVISSDQLAGLKTAAALAATHKEIILLSSGKNILPGLIAEADSVMIEGLLQEAGVRLMMQNRLVEVLGDNEVKAIRLDSGKVIGCQAVLTDVDFPDLRLFKDTELQCSQRVLVNECYQTNFENVFALDMVCDRMTFSDWEVSDNYSDFAQQQAKVVASQIAGSGLASLKAHRSGLDKEFTPVTVPFSWTVQIKDKSLKFLLNPFKPFGLEQTMFQLQSEEIAVPS